ncbi:MAG: M56 family metallopeptidase [Firmicutes bacterium]|nr:M56 family metallopeptidase [Bacillota bacterium]
MIELAAIFFKKIVYLNLNMSLSVLAAIVITKVFRIRKPGVLFAVWSLAVVRFLYDFAFQYQRSLVDTLPLPQHGILTIGIYMKERIVKILFTTLTLNGTVFSSGDLISSHIGRNMTVFLGALMILAGAVLLGVKVSKQVRFGKMLAESAYEAGILGYEGIMVSDMIQTPMVWGILKPKVIIPTSLLCICSDEELKAVINHEKAHIRRMDHVIFPVLSAIRAFFVTVPVLGYAIGKMEEYTEMICDKKAAAEIKSGSSLARALVKIAEFQVDAGFTGSKVPSAVPGFVSNRKIVERRIDSIFRMDKPFKPGFVSVLSAILLAVISFLFIFGSNTF